MDDRPEIAVPENLLGDTGPFSKRR